MWARSETNGHATPDAPAHAQPRPLKILMLTGQFLPVVGGTELSTLREAQALLARGHIARVLTLRHDPRWPAHEVIDGVSVRRAGGLFLRGKLRLRYGATWLAEARIWYELVRARDTYDVVQLRQLGRLTRPAVLASYVTGKPLVVRIAAAPAPLRDKTRDAGESLPGATSATPPGAAKRNLLAYLKARGTFPDLGDIPTLRRIQFLAPLTLRLLRAPHVRFLALSARVRQSLIETGFARERIALLPNGVDPAHYQDIAEHSVYQSAPGAHQTVVCLARLSYQKGQDTLLQAWRLMQERMPPARLILAGEGRSRAQLERLATGLGVADTVEFAGLVRDTKSLLAAARVFVLPSRFEGMPNALLEAMAAGLPCVATRVSGSEDIIVDGQSGLLVPPDDPEALASALLTILTDPQRAHALGREARARVIDAFSQDRTLDELIQLYSSLVVNGGARPQARVVIAAAENVPGAPGNN